jgi:hypothetical protein
MIAVDGGVSSDRTLNEGASHVVFSFVYRYTSFQNLENTLNDQMLDALPL